jgi:hypothetical protein
MEARFAARIRKPTTTGKTRRLSNLLWPKLGLEIRSLLLLILILAPSAHASKYYVSASQGSDNNDGRSPTTPWHTIAHVNQQRLNPGDSVLLRRGDSWCETLKPASSGSPGRPITFGPYGSGAKPILDGACSPTAIADFSIDNNEQSHLIYDNLDLRGAREGLRLYAWSVAISNIRLQNSVISSSSTVPHRTMSAGVYASVHTGSISGVTLRHNSFIPYPAGLEHWGIYFVKGVTNFRIEDNTFGPAGEDAICVWHSSHGVIARNRGGGNGENTIDVKDSHHVWISDNQTDNDAEYNIVVHSVDANDLTYNIVVEGNRCLRGGQGGKLSAGIALLFVRRSKVRRNRVEDAYREGIIVIDVMKDSANEVSHNSLLIGERGRKGIVLDNAAGTRAYANLIRFRSSSPQ